VTKTVSIFVLLLHSVRTTFC